MDIKFIISTLLIVEFFSVFTFSQTLELPKSKNSFIVIAHRGAHSETPENTLSAYQKAIDLGVDFVEIDLRTSKDGQLVVMHDATLKRMAGVDKLIKDVNLDSLKLLKIKELTHPEWGEFDIPTFKEVLALCKNKTNIYLDFKEASAKTAYDEIVDAGMEKNVIVYINSKAQFLDWRKTAPTISLMISLPKAVKTATEMKEFLNQTKVDILDGNYSEYNSETVKAAMDKNVPVWADIQSKTEGPEQWEKAIVTGITGLQTDHPKELNEFLKSKKLR